MAYKTIIGTMKTAGTLDISAGDIDLAAGSVDNADLAGSIANSKLANDSVTVTAGNGLSGGGEVDLGASVSVALDLNELSAAAVAVGADSIAIIDATDNGSKKESIADLVTAMAGDGLAASSGVLAVGVDDSTVEICPHDGFREQGSESQLATPSPRERSALVISPSSSNGMQSPSSPKSDLPSSALVRSEVVESWSARMSLPPSVPASARSACGLGLEAGESQGHDGGRAAWDDTCMASLLHADTPMSSRNGGVTSGTGVSTPLEPPVPTLAPV